MITIRLEGLQIVTDELKKMERQLPFATRNALNKTAGLVKAAIEQEMSSVFDRPTNWTLNSLRISYADKAKPQAKVVMKDEATKSLPATRWLSPEIDGGARADKRSERHLRSQGLLPGNRYVAPGSGAKLDRHGNLSRGQITKMLSGVRGFEEAGFDANATDSRRSVKKGNSKRYFILRRGNMPLGIAERFGSRRDQVRVVLAFVTRPSYRKRLPFYEVGQKVADANLANELNKAIGQALRSAR